MTAEAGECNGRREGFKGEFEVKRGGDLKDSGIACRDGEEIGGSFVIVNGDSDDHSERDLDLEGKPDQTPNAENGKLKLESEEFGEEDESLAEDYDKFSEGSDDKLEKKQGGENLVEESENLVEECSNGDNIEQEREVRVGVEEEQNLVGSGFNIKVEEGEESVKEEKLDSNSQTVGEEVEVDTDTVKVEEIEEENLESGSAVKIQHEEGEEVVNDKDLGSSDSEATGVEADEKEVLPCVEEGKTEIVIAESESKLEVAPEVDKEDVNEPETVVTETDCLEKSDSASLVEKEQEPVSLVVEADDKGDVRSINVEESHKPVNGIEETEHSAESESAVEAKPKQEHQTGVEQTENVTELESAVKVELKQDPITEVEETEKLEELVSAVEIELEQDRGSVVEEMDKAEVDGDTKPKVAVEENDNQAERRSSVQVEPQREPETVLEAADEIEAEEREEPEYVGTVNKTSEHFALENGVAGRSNADGDAPMDELSSQPENGSTALTAKISDNSLMDELNSKTRNILVENSESLPMSHVSVKELVEEISRSSDVNIGELEVSNGETFPSESKTDISSEDSSSSAPVTGGDLEPQREELCPYKDAVIETKDSVEDVETDKDVGLDRMKLESQSGNESAEGSECIVSSIESTNKDDDEQPSHEQAQAAEMIQAPPETHVVKHQQVYMIKVPRFIDDELREKIQAAESTLEEKTKERDSIGHKIKEQTVTVNKCLLDYKAELAKERAARAVFSAKRQEVENTQELINRINNANSIADIDEKIRNMVHRQQHETISLKQEKQYIHDINQMKRLREQLSSKKASQEQIDVALNQIDVIQVKLKNLKKELDSQRAALSSAESSTKSAWNKYMDEVQHLNNLKEERNAANGDRQEAYLCCRRLKNQSAEKFKHFKMYKADQSTASTYIFSGDNQGLRSHCSRQVESIIDLWNNNKEFREQYVKSNIYSTLRRLGTSDGRSLGPGEEAPILRRHVDKSSNALSKASSNIETPAPLLTPEVRQGNLTEPSATKQIARISQSAKLKPSAKSALAEGSLPIVNSKDSMEAEKENKLKKEEEELARKAEELARKEEELRKEKAAKEEELRKEKAAAELKEQLRLEQRAKAREAEERKRRKAEKAQAKAEYRAQKEAELKEKKKAKENKKYGITDNGGTERGSTPVPETNSPETSQEPETSSGPTLKKRSARPASLRQYNRVQSPLPLPLRNRGKRKMTAWVPASLVILLVLVLFFAGNYMSFSMSGLLDFGF